MTETTNKIIQKLTWILVTSEWCILVSFYVDVLHIIYRCYSPTSCWPFSRSSSIVFQASQSLYNALYMFLHHDKSSHTLEHMLVIQLFFNPFLSTKPKRTCMNHSCSNIFFTSDIIFYLILVTYFYSHFSSKQRLYALKILIIEKISVGLV